MKKKYAGTARATELNLWMRTDKTLEQEGAPRDVISHLGDAPSKVAEKLESLAVDWSKGFHCYF